MEPTLYSNNILITDRISPRLNRIQRGDIIIAKSPSNPSQHVCKRVIGLPGDRISVESPLNFNPFANSSKTSTHVETGEQLVIDDGPKIDAGSGLTFSINKLKCNDVVVPRGHVWIEGDNSENSSDSRYYGPIPQGLIRSKAIFRIWPFNDMRILSN